MIKRSYLSLLWSQYRGTSIILTLLIALFQLLIIWIFNSLNATPFLETVFNQLPLQLRLLFEQEFMPALSVAGAVAFGFNHPLVLIAISIVAVVIPSRQIAGESENGRLEMLLSLPIKRKELTFSLLIFTSGISLMIITGGMVGSMTGLLITGNFNLSLLCNLLEICINLWLVFLLIGSYSILISVFSQEGSRAGLLSGGLTLIFYLFYFLSSVWPPLEFTRYFNIFYYYQPQRLMFDKIEFLDNIFVLLITAAICILAFLVRFEKRDIP
ncbi:MAG: ABC transporter permease subunit [Calditrichaeota bacterium]|nr:ABC transporter permease subunit [Calditrichota bacterium]